MTPQELKNSILQLAIQGKLVEQCPEEGTAEELYHQMQTEKQALIKAGKIKKEKPLPEITEDEKPFDIPESWKWMRLGECSTYSSAKEKISPSDITGDMWSLDLEDIEKETGKIVNYCFAKNRKIAGDKVVFHSGQILYSKLRPYLKKILVAPKNGICTPELVPFSMIGAFENAYILYVLKAPHIDFVINSVTYGVKMPRVGTDTMVNLLIPVPPLAEQKRIVTKIGELLPLINRYEEAWTKLEDFNKRFPGDMQKSLLQMAIQGKLVKQRPEEGTGEELYQKIQEEKARLIKAGKIKKDKPLPEIAEDEKPFDIPESWMWVRLGEILTSTDAGKSPQCEDRSRTGNEWGVIKTTAIQNGFFLPEENKVLPEKFAVQEGQIVHSGDLLITRAGPRNRTGVLCVVSDEPTNLILSDKTVRLSYIKGLVEPMFIMYMLNSPAGQVSIIGAMTGMAASQVNISQDSMKKFLLALPPLAEQKRIVAKLEELLPLCERLK